MTRIRYGLTGLALVFLLVLSAAALFGPARETEAPAASAPQGEDPLATLGVAPGSEPADPAPQPPPRAEAGPREGAPLVPFPNPSVDDLRQPDPFGAIPDPERPNDPAADGELVEI